MLSLTIKILRTDKLGISKKKTLYFAVIVLISQIKKMFCLYEI